MTPFTIGSGGSGISASLSAASSTRSDNCGICSGGANIRSIGSSMSFSIGSSVTTQVCPIRARTWPVTWTRPPLWGVTSSEALADRTSRKPATSAIDARAAGSASMSRCNPVSGICATTTGTLQGSAVIITSIVSVHGSASACAGDGNVHAGASSAASSVAARLAMALSA